ncbi:MAG TPA: membrane protein insertase YidC [Desulfomicrobiaceae bacterium]|nr:membrane protein insertase YidC [Desulfomicrobiaceae bacterium]
MDNRRVILAVTLSLAVLIVWNFLFPPVQAPLPVDNGTAQQQETVSEPMAPIQEPVAPAVTAATFTPTKGEQVTVDTPLYRAVFNTAGGVIEHFVLKEYKETVDKDSAKIDLVAPRALSKAPLGVIWNRVPTWNKGEWGFDGADLNLTGGEEKTLTFVGRVGGVQLTRTLTFVAGSYEIREDLKVANTSAAQVRGDLSFTLSSIGLSAEGDTYNPTRVSYLLPSGLEEEDDLDDLKLGIQSETPVRWGSIGSNYFMVGLVPTSGDMTMRAKYEDDVYRLTLGEMVNIDPGMQRELSCSYYLGPKTESALGLLPKDLKASINYGFFDIIAKPLITGLKYFYGYVGNYGVAIILLTILIKILFWPLSHKSYKSMEQMKKLQPMMAQLREKYSDDREKMNAELMQLYKTYKVNPAGGCLPMLLQIPVFIALYQALLGAIELRHAVFIPNVPFTDLPWLIDLSAKDPYYVTPLIMGATMFLQQKMTPSPGDPMQAKIMLFMPVVFTFIFLNFPSGLVVYWMVNNILSIGQQWMMIRKA